MAKKKTRKYPNPQQDISFPGGNSVGYKEILRLEGLGTPPYIDKNRLSIRYHQAWASSFRNITRVLEEVKPESTDELDVLSEYVDSLLDSQQVWLDTIKLLLNRITGNDTFYNTKVRGGSVIGDHYKRFNLAQNCLKHRGAHVSVASASENGSKYLFYTIDVIRGQTSLPEPDLHKNPGDVFLPREDAHIMAFLMIYVDRVIAKLIGMTDEDVDAAVSDGRASSIIAAQGGEDFFTNHQISRYSSKYLTVTFDGTRNTYVHVPRPSGQGEIGDVRFKFGFKGPIQVGMNIAMPFSGTQSIRLLKADESWPPRSRDVSYTLRKQ